MRRIPLVLALALVCSAGVSATASAQTRTEVINGATCIPYPPFDATNAAPYNHFLYGFRQSAFCHINMSNDWRVGDIAYVLLTASTSDVSTPIKIRLCVYGSGSLSVSCSGEKNLTTVNWVALPGSLPSSPAGAFVRLRFPTGKISTIRSVIPVWTK